MTNAGYTLAPPMDDIIERERMGEDAFETLPAGALSVEPWTYFAKAIIAANQGDWIGNSIMIGLIVALVIFGVINILLSLL